MATTNIDFKNITSASYNGTNLKEIWWCCISNATCCRIWPPLPTTINFNLNCCSPDASGYTEVASGKLGGFYYGWYTDGSWGQGALGDGIKLFGCCEQYRDSCPYIRVNNTSPFTIRVSTSVVGQANGVIAWIKECTCSGWQDMNIVACTYCICDTVDFAPHTNCACSGWISNVCSRGTDSSWHVGKTALVIVPGRRAWSTASGTVTVCWGVVSGSTFQEVGRKVFNITSPSQNLIL